MIFGLAALLPMLFSYQVSDVIAEFPISSVTDYSMLETAQGWLPRINGAYSGWTAGTPSLPLVPWSVQLPAGYEAAGVEFEANWEDLPPVHIAPLPAPAPLCSPVQAGEPAPDPLIYSSPVWWPATPVQLSGTGFGSSSPEAGLLVSPFRWNPCTGELQHLRGLSARIILEQSRTEPSPALDQQVLRMLIVTDVSLLETFQLLAERRTDQGILTEVISMNQVYSSAPGRDDAERLRNFVIDYRLTNGLDYLLLGGDSDLVPFRYAYAMTCEAGMHPREDSLPCDLYFSDLDGTWDANGNGVFGELEDGVDLFPDVIVGRAPVETPAEAQAFLDKIATYEDASLPTDHYEKTLFLAMILWEDPYTDSGESKDYILESFVPGGIEVTRLYQSLGNENLGTVMLAMNEGTNCVNHDGHAWWSSLGMGDDYMTAEHLDAINSDGRFAAFMYSIGCWSAAFDFDAVGEHFVTNAEGCGASYIGNSSYGWGSPGNPCYGYSDALDHVFFQLLYEYPSLTCGELLAKTKEQFIPYSRWENVYRWHQYDVNLLGDPTLRPYRTSPQDPGLSCPSIVTPNTQFFPVTVSVQPVEGLTVCIRDQGSIWMVQEPDASGRCEFILTEQVQGAMKITVTGPGVRRTSLTVQPATGPDPVISELTVDDDAGLGHLSPGCTADLIFQLTNQGTEQLTNIQLLIDSVSGPGVLLQGTTIFDDLSPGALSEGDPPLSLSVDTASSSGDLIRLFGELSTDQGQWDFMMPLLVYSPGLYFATYSVNDSASGNGDGCPDPGETFDLELSLANLGLLQADDVWVVMTEAPAWMTWLSDTSWTNSVPPGGTADFSFTCELDQGAPSPSFPWLIFDAGSMTAGYATSDSLRLTVGQTGISNDVESGEQNWTHYGTGDLWNITDAEYHSGSHCWRCGDTDGYSPGMDCSLLSPPIVLAPQASMSFWASFDVSIYGSDGLYVIVNDPDTGDADTLDYIGSGGALGSGFRGTGTGWCQWTYQLSGFEAGDEVQLELNFVSDSNQEAGDGFFIDDISVQGAYVGGTGSPGGSSGVPATLGAPWPNPTFGLLSIPLMIEGSGLWDLGIYDMTGRLLISEQGEAPFQGLLGMDISGLAAGIYLVRLAAPSGVYSVSTVRLPGT